MVPFRDESQLLTSREGQLDLLFDNFNRNEIMPFIKPAIIKQQAISLPGSKPMNNYKNYKKNIQNLNA